VLPGNAPFTDKARFIKLVAAALVVVVAGLLLIGGHEFRALIEQAHDLLRAAGPTKFFFAMALVPAIGFPLSFFCLTAGSAFAPQLGMSAAILLSLAAIAANIALSYLLATRALRPPLEYLLKHLGYQLPKVQSGDVTDLIVLLRVTPGLPFPVQNYLLGLASVPFFRYYIVSCLIAFPLNAAIILFGEALLQGGTG
jgi:uncharacterized membrane protein YdjX (TVP38/TMEM64 family)